MMGYKDRTWCSSPACRNLCGRQFTEEERNNAIRWWCGTDFPLCTAEFCDDKGELKRD